MKSRFKRAGFLVYSVFTEKHTNEGMEAAESSLVVKLPRTVISSEVQRSREICLEIDLSISLRSSRDDDRLLKHEVVTFASLSTLRG
jgi:hypothetical protein